MLVGPMGAGKTTVGKQLANRLSYEFVDTDHYIEEKSGADIPWIFDVEGERGFRSRETAALDDLSGIRSHVIATGGGVVVTPCNAAKLSALGCVVYLKASVNQLYHRTAKDKRRPLLQVENPRARIEELLQQRDPLYTAVADCILETDGRSSRWVVSEILNWLGES